MKIKHDNDNNKVQLQSVGLKSVCNLKPIVILFETNLVREIVSEQSLSLKFRKALKLLVPIKHFLELILKEASHFWCTSWAASFCKNSSFSSLSSSSFSKAWSSSFSFSTLSLFFRSSSFSSSSFSSSSSCWFSTLSSSFSFCKSLSRLIRDVLFEK